jgi:hypothetical protein
VRWLKKGEVIFAVLIVAMSALSIWLGTGPVVLSP